VVDCIKRLGDVDGNCCGTRGWLTLVEAVDNCGCNGEQGSGGGMKRGKVMLGVRFGQGGGYKGEEESLQNFDGRGEKGDGPKGGTLVKGFSRFGDGDDVSCLPNYRNVCTANGQVKYVGQVGQSPVTKVFQVQSSQTVRANRRRVARPADGIIGGGLRKRGKRRI
jgi:hypothetical protein